MVSVTHFETRSYPVSQSGLELIVTLMPHYRHEPLYTASTISFKAIFIPSMRTLDHASCSSIPFFLCSSISMQTGKCQWEKPRFKECKLLQALPDKIVDLANITISDGKTVLCT